MNKLVIILFTLFLFKLMPYYIANANDCPKYQFAKVYKMKYGNSPLSGRNYSFSPGANAKVKRLTSTDYLFGNDLVVTENCGKVSWTFDTTSNIQCPNGTFAIPIQLVCDGFLRKSKVIEGTCAFSFSTPCGDIEDAVSFKFRPAR